MIFKSVENYRILIFTSFTPHAKAWDDKHLAIFSIH